MHILIVEARFYDDILDELSKGAIRALENARVTYERIPVPGALEIPVAVRMAAETGKYDAYVALGCVIRGETTHYEIVSNESARGLMNLALAHGLAIGNGILTVENEDQAWARARLDQQDKGGDAARAALRLATLRKQFSGVAA